MKMTLLKHHFLIAMPVLKDSTFGRCVIYVCEHNADGAMGLIINKPMPISLDKVLRHLHIESSSKAINSEPVYMGGPVGQEQGFILYEEKEKDGKNVEPELKISTAIDVLVDIAAVKKATRFLVTLGYAGWEKGQLEQEISNNDWLVVPYHSSILFDTQAEKRWQVAAKLLGVNIHHLTEQVGHG